MKKVVALALALTMAVSLAACGTTAPAGSGSGTSAAATTGLYPGTAAPDSAAINIASEPPEVNSITTTDSTAFTVLQHVNEGLTSLDAENNAVPGVAESWTPSEDGLTWIFKLRENAVWSNGEPVTAHDFDFAWTRLFTPASGAQYAGTWSTYIQGAAELLAATTEEEVKAAQENLGVKAVDDYTLEVTLTVPCAYFANLVAFASFYPVNEKFYTEVGMEDGYALDMDKMLFNGPYVMTEWQHEDHISLTKNENYWDKENKALIPNLEFKMIGDSGAGLNAFQGGELDMIGLSGEQAEMLRAEGTNVQQYADGSPLYLQYNTTTPLLSSAKVRRAITLAIDAESYNKNVAKNGNLTADGMVPPVVNNGKYSEKRGDLINRPTDGDYTEVKALFDEGCAELNIDPSTVTLRYITDEGDNAYKMAAFVQNELKEKLGVNITIEAMPFKSRLDAQTNMDFDICPALWGPDYDDAMTYLDLFASESGNNHTGWANEEYDALIEAAFHEGDAVKHRDLLIQAETLLMEEMPIGPIYFRVRDYVTSDKLTGVVRNAFQETVMNYATIVG